MMVVIIRASLVFFLNALKKVFPFFVWTRGLLERRPPSVLFSMELSLFVLLSVPTCFHRFRRILGLALFLLFPTVVVEGCSSGSRAVCSTRISLVIVSSVTAVNVVLVCSIMGGLVAVALVPGVASTTVSIFAVKCFRAAIASCSTKTAFWS